MRANSPGTLQIDLSADKSFLLSEHGRLEVRSEFYNIFNHPQLGQPQPNFNPSNTNGFGGITTTVNLNLSRKTPGGNRNPA